MVTLQRRIMPPEGFAKLLKRIETYRTRKARKTVTLNEKKFFEEGDEANAENEEEELVAKEYGPERKIKRDYYLDEVLNITRDYVNALRQTTFARVN